MGGYIRTDESIGYKYGRDHKAILAAIGNRFIGSNPPAPFVFRTFHTKGILCNRFGQYVFNIHERFEGNTGRHAYAFGKLWSESDRNAAFSIACYGPVKAYVNKKLVFASTTEVEGFLDKKTKIPVDLKKGWNGFFLQFEKTATGFGCEFGNAAPQWDPCNFYSPFIEREGKAGFAFTAPLREVVFSEDNLPDLESKEADTGLQWFPDGRWDEKVLQLPAICRVFDGAQKGKAYAWTSIDVTSAGSDDIHLVGEAYSEMKIWLDGTVEHFGQGSFDMKAELGYGKHNILVESTCLENGSWGFRLDVFRNGESACFAPPCDINGYDGAWLYLGVFDAALNAQTDEIQDLYRLFDNVGQGVYWRVDERDTVIRPFVENALFGRWTYPLGVTLYGLLRYGEASQREDMLEYVREHVALVTKMHAYALYDKGLFGYPGINHQIAWLDALDDCGSFGSLMLECNKKWRNEDAIFIASMIADHMMNKQARREDGVFNRRGVIMWVDDLYMSVPFLCRYHQLTQDPEYLDEACRQILLFEKHLFMKDTNTMSHIYSIVHNKATNIPWGRGNGWAIFSITELLEVLPADHAERVKIIDLYNRLVAGYIKLQGKNGIWHQVLNRDDTYEESSCTAMFICAFTRGIISGYVRSDILNDAVSSVFRAWKGLTHEAIDYHGNIYGICRGSGWSFSAEYYKGLSWNFNDTHGIGIIMLAGTEVMRLEAYLSNGRRTNGGKS